MIKKILPIILALLGTAAGVGAGIALKPEAKPVAENPCGDLEQHADAKNKADKDPKNKDDETAYEYVDMSNQFVVPLVTDGRVSSMIVLGLSVEATAGKAADVRKNEPKLRDGMLRIMFDHANYGGFSGNFTSVDQLDPLLEMLAKEAQRSLPGIVHGIRVQDFMRQDL